MTRRRDLTPTWAAVLPALSAVLQDGTREGQELARQELARMAEAADLWNATAEASPDPNAVPEPAAVTPWTQGGRAVFGAVMPRPLAPHGPVTGPRYSVDGEDKADASNVLDADGTFPPFRVFDSWAQEHAPTPFPTREAAQRAADAFNATADALRTADAPAPAVDPLARASSRLALADAERARDAFRAFLADRTGGNSARALKAADDSVTSADAADALRAQELAELRALQPVAERAATRAGDALSACQVADSVLSDALERLAALTSGNAKVPAVQPAADRLEELRRELRTARDAAADARDSASYVARRLPS